MQPGVAEQTGKYLSTKKLRLLIQLTGGAHLFSHRHTQTYTQQLLNHVYNLIIMSRENRLLLLFFFFICRRCIMAGFILQLQKALNIYSATLGHTLYMIMLNSFKCHLQNWGSQARWEVWDALVNHTEINLPDQTVFSLRVASFHTSRAGGLENNLLYI